METNTIAWEQPPYDPGSAPRVRARQIDEQVAMLKTKPGQWAVLERSDRPNRLSNAAQPYRARGCQVTVQDGQLFVRWPA
jgi:hypothetical protein